MKNYLLITISILPLCFAFFMHGLDVQLTNTTRKPVIVTIETEATRAKDLLTLDKQSIEGVRNSSTIQDLPIWLGTTIKAIRPGATLRIKQVHPMAESITVDKQPLALTNLSDAKERSPKTLSFSIVPGTLWGIKYERLAADYKPTGKAGSYKEVAPRTTQYLTAIPKK